MPAEAGGAVKTIASGGAIPHPLCSVADRRAAFPRSGNRTLTQGSPLKSPPGLAAEFTPVHLLSLVSDLVASKSDLDDILSSTVTLVKELLRVERCSIFLMSPETGKLVAAAAVGIPRGLIRTLAIPVGEGIVGQVAASGEARLGEATSAARAADANSAGYTTNTYISAPITAAGKVYGVINVTNRYDRTRLGAGDLEVVRSIASLLGVAIDRHHLDARVGRLVGDLSKTLENLPSGVVGIDGGNRVFTINPRARQLLGCGDITGRQVSDALPEDLAKALIALADEAIRGVTPRRVELECHQTSTPLKLRAVPIIEDTGGACEALILIEDMSLRREVEELRRVDQLKTNFITIVSHELRTPLTSIRGAGAILAQQLADKVDESHRSLLRILTTNAERMVELVNMIVDTALIEQNRMELLPEKVDLDTILAGVVSEHAAAYRAKELDVHYDHDGEVPAIRADKARLRQVLQELMRNAVKFSEKNGSIHVTAGVKGSIVSVRVKDTGPGIPVEERERVFDRFYQIEDPLTRRAGGSGLGLYLSRQIAQLHGGDLIVEDTARGTCMLLTLPLQRTG